MPEPTPEKHRINELTQLLETCRQLSNILNPEELYLRLNDIIVEKFDAGSFAIFIYQSKQRAFSQAFAYGKTISSRKIRRTDLGLIGERFSGIMPFTVEDIDDLSEYQAILVNSGLADLNPEMFAPLYIHESLIILK